MSKNRKKPSRARLRRRQQRRRQNLAVALTVLCAAAIVTMAFVNRMPIGNRYTYTEESDLWFVNDGELLIAAPAVPLYAPTPTVEPSPTPTPEPTGEPAEY